MAKNKKNQTAQDFINVEAIEGDLIYTQGKYLLQFIQVRGIDNSLVEDGENQIVTEGLSLTLADERDPWQLLSVPRTVDIQGMMAELDALRAQTDNPANLMLLDGETAALEEMMRSGAKEPMLLLKLWIKAAPGADRTLRERSAAITKKLADAGVTAWILDAQALRRLCAIYADLGVWQPEADEAPDVPTLTGAKRSWHRKSGEPDAHMELLRDITPVGGLFFGRNTVEVGNALCRCFGVVKFPSELPYGWMVGLMNATDCITCVEFVPGSAAEIGDALSRAVARANREAAAQHDARTRKQQERQASDAERMIDQLDAHNKAIGQLSIVTMAFAENEEALRQACDRVVARYAARRMRLRVLAHVQKEAFRHLSPYYPGEALVHGVLDRVVPLDTLMGGYPMTVSVVRDDHGLYFGRTEDRGVVSLDLLCRGKDRTNGNGIVTGQSGTGKSTALKHILLSMYMRGVKIIVIDPEREFRELCKALNGSWWDAGGGGAKINLLHVRHIPEDDETQEAYRSSGSDLDQHMQSLMMILQYKLHLTDGQQGLLKRYLLRLYADFGITRETDAHRIPAENYPVMRDLYNLLVAHEQEDPQLSELILLIEDMCIGADAGIWNGKTTVSFDNNLVVIDTNQLNVTTQQNQAAQYYNLLLMAMDAATADRTTPYMIIADEAQMLFDPELPQAAKALKNFAERLRKYEGCFWLALHTLDELLDPAISKYGQPVLDSAAYKVLFGTDGQNLAQTVELFHLTPAERRVLAARHRGRALCTIGSMRLLIHFELPLYKLEVIGKGGGR